MREARPYCQLCAGMRALRLRVDDDGRVVDIRGDCEDPLTAGYACVNGLQWPAAHSSPKRLLHPLKRRADGRFEHIDLEQALDETASKLAVVPEHDGPDAIGAFRGTLSDSNYMLPAFVRALGSHGVYSTMTVDQSAKWVWLRTARRLGRWRRAVRDGGRDSARRRQSPGVAVDLQLPQRASS